VYWRNDRALGLIEPPSVKPIEGRAPLQEKNRISVPIDLDTAIAEMDALGHRLLFFEDAATGRGNVIYRRYDGHYGLIGPPNVALGRRSAIHDQGGDAR
jgi:Sigma 54 modulation/S30EA ribosomal protein C terminus